MELAFYLGAIVFLMIVYLALIRLMEKRHEERLEAFIRFYDQNTKMLEKMYLKKLDDTVKEIGRAEADDRK